MKSIYLHGLFPAHAPKNLTFNTFIDSAQLPNNCELIGITFWDGMLDTRVDLIKELLLKTNKLAIGLPEPTMPKLLYDFTNLFNTDKIHFLAMPV